MLRATPLLAISLLVMPLGTISVAGLGGGPCWSQWVHEYVAAGLPPGAPRSRTLLEPGPVTVVDTNLADCNGDGVPLDFDGDYDLGSGGGFFGRGPWANAWLCQNELNQHGSHYVVMDILWGPTIPFFVGEDDMDGPLLIQVDQEYVCLTDGMITPGPWTDPTADPDDCLSGPWVGTGTACGTGGSDGGDWVILTVVATLDVPGGISLTNPATEGTIAAY